MAHFCMPTKPANGGQARSSSGTLTRADENAHDFYTEVALLQDYISYTTVCLCSFASSSTVTDRYISLPLPPLGIVRSLV